MTTYTSIAVQKENQIDVGYEALRFVLNVGIGMATLIGIWGMACLIGGFVTSGAGDMLRGFLAATLGW